MDSQNVSISDVFKDDFHSLSPTEELNITCQELKTVFIQELPKNFQNPTFQLEITKLKSTFSDILLRIKIVIDGSATSVDDLKGLLQLGVDILACLFSAVSFIENGTKYESVCSLPPVTGEILCETFEHCKNSERIYGTYFDNVSNSLSNLFTKAKEVQCVYLRMLNERILFDPRSPKEISALKNGFCDRMLPVLHESVLFADILARIGVVLNELDIRTFAELWKQFVTFTERYSDVLTSRVDVSVPIAFLAAKIVTEIDTITKSGEDAEKELKKLSFNLKIIVKLCDIYSENLGNSYEKLLELLLVLNKCSAPVLKSYCRNTKLIESVQINLFAGTAPLVKNLISDRQFVHCYFRNVTGFLKNDMKLAAVLLSAQIMSKIVTVDAEVRRGWLQDDEFNIVHAIFKFVPKSHYELMIDLPFSIQGTPGKPSHSTSLYEYVLINTASVVISTTPAQFVSIEKLLLKSVLQTDPWTAMFAADIWSICARYGSEDFCYKQLDSLIEMLGKIRGDRLENVFLRHVVSRLFSFLTETYRRKLLRSRPLHRNIKLWSTLGAFDVPNNEIVEAIAGRVNKVVAKTCTVDDFNEMCDYLELSKGDRSTVPICELWGLSGSEDVSKSTWFQKFIRTLISATKNTITAFDTKQLQQILKNVLQFRTASAEIKIQIPDVLRSLAKVRLEKSQELKETFTIIVEICKYLLNDNEPLVKEKTLEAFDEFVHNVSQLETFALYLKNETKLQEELSKYLRKNSCNIFEYNELCKKRKGVSFMHRCDVNTGKSFEPQRKKLKTTSDININIVLERMGNDGGLVIDYFRSNVPSDDHRNKLLKIIEKINKVL